VTDQRTSGLAVIDRAFTVLEACAASRRTVSLADLVRLTGLPKTTLHRLCWKLEALGALEQHQDGFRIGPKLFAFGAMNPTVQRLRTASMPFLYDLSASTGHISNLAVMQGGQALLIDEVFAAEKPVPRMVGALLPLHATALGKVLLAAQPVPVRRALVGTDLLPAFTRHTIIRPNILLDHLEVIAHTGLAYSREEWRLGFAGVAASVPADGRRTAALALVGIPRATDLERYGQAVRSAADELALALRRPVIRDHDAWAGEDADAER
jgi:DNA-binding IclR family transcriptional regulator